jgi:hypothetical protein
MKKIMADVNDVEDVEIVEDENLDEVLEAYGLDNDTEVEKILSEAKKDGSLGRFLADLNLDGNSF